MLGAVKTLIGDLDEVKAGKRQLRALDEEKYAYNEVLKANLDLLHFV